jgi:hypothetical protein
MPKLISIAIEGPKHYIALDSEGHVWSGRVTIKRGGGPSVVKWERANSEFPGSSERVRFVGGHEQQEED